MNQDPNDGLQPPELRPEMQPLETESESTLSQQPGAYYAPPGYAPPAPAGATTSAWRWAIVGVAAAAAVTAGVWYAMTPPAPPPPVPAVTTPAQTDEANLASSGAADFKATEYLKGVLGSQANEITRGGSPAAPADTSTAESQLHAANAAALIELGKTAPDVAKEIRDGRRQLYPIRQGDEVEGDPFHVELYVDGADVGDVYHGKGRILVPLIPGRPAHLKLVPSVVRGGIGVPVGLILPSGELWRTGIMPVGGSEERQITVP